MPKFVAPELLLDVFTCPYCDVTAKQAWCGNTTARRAFQRDESEESSAIGFSSSGALVPEVRNWLFSICENCGNVAVWHEDEMVHPFSCPVGDPNPDMPEDVKAKYLEASEVVASSPASAAALLRLGLQVLLREILQDESSGNIYKDIVKLKERPIDSSLVKALDIIRIAGNESVHPGTLDLSESRDDALYLFELLNMVCDQFFTQPNRLKEMYEKMPASRRLVKEPGEDG